MLAAGVKKFVFSSTCATYGTPATLPIVETMPQAPINPYGQTKLDVENALKALATAHGLSFAAFRYFNAAGAAEDGTIGEDHTPETHLIPLAFDAATGRRPHIEIFGTDYPTPDGTCLRDYVHVSDLADAHVKALESISGGGHSAAYNLGTGQPHSVREVIDTVAQVTGRDVPWTLAPRRPGDPAVLYAAARKAEAELGWVPKLGDLETIVRTAWDWHRTHPRGYDEK
jgi:UDP-glucose 4-epimerase